MDQCASLTRTSSAPPSKKPRAAAFTSEVNRERQRSHCGVPGSTSAGQVTPVAPSMSALTRIFRVKGGPVTFGGGAPPRPEPGRRSLPGSRYALDNRQARGTGFRHWSSPVVSAARHLYWRPVPLRSSSIRASSSGPNSRLRTASTLFSSCATLLAPTSAEVTRPPRSTQASAIWARD